MEIKQISVFLENRAGQLSEITGILSANGVDLKAINIAETQDYGILRLIADDSDKASSVLKENGFILSVTPVVAISVPDRPGGLSELLGIIAGAGIDIEYMYSVFGHLDGQAYMIFKVNDTQALAKLLKKSELSAAESDELGIN